MLKPRLEAKTTYTMLASHVTPIVLFEYDALIKTHALVDGCSTEIGWLGVVEKENIEENIYVVKDVMLFKQNASAVTTEIQSETLQELAEEILSQENGMEIWNNIRLWGHSHVNMGVSPSGQDDIQMNIFANNTNFMIRVIANKRGEMEVDVYDYEKGIKYKNVPWDVFDKTVEKSEEEISIETFVAEKRKQLEDELKAYNDRLVELEQANLSTLESYNQSVVKEIKESIPKKVLPIQTVAYARGNNWWNKDNTQPGQTKLSNYDDYDSYDHYGHLNSGWKGNKKKQIVTKEFISANFTQQEIDEIANNNIIWVRNSIFTLKGGDWADTTWTEREEIDRYIKSNNMQKSIIPQAEITAKHLGNDL